MALVQQRPKSKRRDIQGLMSFGMMVCYLKMIKSWA
jgi:hypothetical protein